MLILPATPEVIAGFIGRGRGRSRGALDDRQRDARAADAVPARGASRQAGRDGAAGLRRAASSRRARDRAVPGARQAVSPTWCGRCATRRSTRRRTIVPPDRGGRHDVRRWDRPQRGGDDRRAPTASDATMRVAQLRVLGGAMARVSRRRHGVRPPARRIMVNLAAFYDGPEDRAYARPGSRRSRRRCTRATPAPTSTS